MRLLPPEAVVQGGEIVFDGANLLGKGEAEMEKLRGREIGMVFQEPMTSLNPVFTVGRQIGESLAIHFPAMSKDEIRNEVYQLLEHVGISNAAKRFDQYPHQLSGGMRQRVMIAMAVACKPKLLIADEPTTALDVTIQAQVLELMKKLVSESESSMMLITHNLGVVAETCDEAVVMYAGQIVEKGSVDHIFKPPFPFPTPRGSWLSIPSLSHGEAGFVFDSRHGAHHRQIRQGVQVRLRCAHKKPGCENRLPPWPSSNPGHFVPAGISGVH